jgi:hypothetical protein
VKKFLRLSRGYNLRPKHVEFMSGLGYGFDPS